MLQLGGQGFQPGERLFQRGSCQVVLAEKIEKFGAEADAGVELGIRAGDIGAELDQVFGVAVGRQGVADFAGGLLLRGAGDGAGAAG